MISIIRRSNAYEQTNTLWPPLFLLCLPWGGIKAQHEAEKGILFHDNANWESILHLADKENKMIFMDCYTTWCGPCKALAKNVFPKPQVGDFFNPRFINVKYDMEQGEGKMLYVRYKKYIVGFPTLLLLDAKGNVLHQLAGYHDADRLIKAVRQASEGKDLFHYSRNIGRENVTLLSSETTWVR